MARHAERCILARAILSVRLSVCHTTILCPDELRHDRAVFSIW